MDWNVKDFSIFVDIILITSVQYFEFYVIMNVFRDFK